MSLDKPYCFGYKQIKSSLVRGSLVKTRLMRQRIQEIEERQRIEEAEEKEETNKLPKL